MYKWAAKNNKGVTHYGCHPLLFKLEEAFPDMFHQDCAITKTLLGTVRDIYGGSRLSFQEAFNKQLCKIWDEHHWTMGTKQTSFLFQRKGLSRICDGYSKIM